MSIRELLRDPEFVQRLGALVETMTRKSELYVKDLERRYGRTERCIFQWLATHQLPPPSGYNGRSPTWTLHEIEQNERRNPKLKKSLSK